MENQKTWNAVEIILLILKNVETEPALANIGFDTAENGPLKGLKIAPLKIPDGKQ